MGWRGAVRIWNFQGYWKNSKMTHSFKIITVSRPSTLSKVFFYARELREGSPSKPRSCLVSTPLKNQAHPSLSWSNTQKKVSNSSRQIFPQILSPGCVFSYTIMTYLKKLDGSKSFNTVFNKIISQNCTFNTVSIKIISQKFPPLLKLLYCTLQVWTVPLPLGLYGKPWRWERILPNNQKLSHFPQQKNPP